MPISDEALDRAVSQVLAKDIIGMLDTEHRNAFLERALQKALNGYTLTNEIEKIVSERAQQIAKELAIAEDWTARITQAIQEGFNHYIKQLPGAVTHLLCDEMHGNESKGGYGSSNWAGDIRKVLKSPLDKEK